MRKAICSCIVAAVCLVPNLQAQTTVLYETGFESAEGYDRSFDLAGQRGWRIDGTGGNGLLEDWFPGFGQQAYIGFTPPTTNSVTTVWRPVDFNPAPANNPIVKFAVKMQVVQSTTGGDDDFRWSVYNSNGNRLFGISFETGTRQIWFQNEDLEFQSTQLNFDFDGVYDLEIWMDFGHNSWTARLNDVVLANAQPIAITNTTALTLGDVDAVWFINNPAGVGNNFMLFDEYRITSERLSAIPVFLEAATQTSGFFQFWIHGQVGVTYRVEYSTDLVHWNSHGDFPNTAGSFLFEDDQSGGSPFRFYRLQEVL